MSARHLRRDDERDLQRLTDDEVVEIAIGEERIILTHDLDFSRIVALSAAERPSVISFRLNNMRGQNVIAYLKEVIDHFADNLESGALISVQEDAIRVRRLPVDDE